MTAAMNRLRRECADFFNQIYIGERRVLVFGEGDERAPFMLVGEAPGEKEALEGKPFAGMAGRKLDELLQSVDLPRNALYITNAIKFRPTKLSKMGRTINRAPTHEEIALCRPWLMKEITLINPKLIITLGNTALYAVTKSDRVIGDVHGSVINIDGIPPVFALYHPASVEYRKLSADSYKQDLSALRHIMQTV